MESNKWKAKLQSLYSKTVLLTLGILLLALISIVAPFLGFDGGDDSVDLIWWIFWAVVWVAFGLSIVSVIYVLVSQQIRKHK